jgi:hypothetical protein
LYGTIHLDKLISFKHLFTNILKEIGNSVKILDKLETHSGSNQHPSASNSARYLALISDMCPTDTCPWEYLSEVWQCGRATGDSLQYWLMCFCLVIATDLNRNVRNFHSHHALELFLQYTYRYIEAMFLTKPHILLTMYEIYITTKQPALFSVSTNKSKMPSCSVVSTSLLSTAWKILVMKVIF